MFSPVIHKKNGFHVSICKNENKFPAYLGIHNWVNAARVFTTELTLRVLVVGTPAREVVAWAVDLPTAKLGGNKAPFGIELLPAGTVFEGFEIKSSGLDDCVVLKILKFKNFIESEKKEKLCTIFQLQNNIPL